MDFERIYAHHAREYDQLVSAEDCERQLLPAVDAIVPLSGASILEVGVGTARITRQFLGRAARIVGIDRSMAMLEVAREHLSCEAPLAQPRVTDWELLCADAGSLPLLSGWADLAIAGWVFGHQRYWHPQSWRERVGQALYQMQQVLKPKGRLVIIETLGTGHTEPRAPTAELAEYFDWLDRAQGMNRVAIRTDYNFPSVETAAAVTGFFFGEDFAAQVRRQGWTRVPECTGLWWKAP
jgi:ubiquinone/menaquinone biosynthesis C-methylase UbiE